MNCIEDIVKSQNSKSKNKLSNYNGSVVVTRNKGNLLLLGESMIDTSELSNVTQLKTIDYDENFKCITKGSDYDILAIYNILDLHQHSLHDVVKYLDNFISSQCIVKLSWLNVDEINIDWSKIPNFTRVLVRTDDVDSTWMKRYFINKYCGDCKYFATPYGEFSYCGQDIVWTKIKIYDFNDLPYNSYTYKR